MDRLSKRVFRVSLNTEGGLWSDRKAQVRTTHLQVPYVDVDGDFGELCVYFDTSDWNTEQHGLIYTDNLWLDQFRVALRSAGFDPSDVCYSEQGMQGLDYVSLDVGERFLTSWQRHLAAVA